MDQHTAGVYSKVRVSQMFGVSLRTLDNWLNESKITIGKDKGDKRRAAFTYEQVERLANDHGRETSLLELDQEEDEGGRSLLSKLVKRVFRLQDRQQHVEQQIESIQTTVSSLTTNNRELSRHLSSHDGDIARLFEQYQELQADYARISEQVEVLNKNQPRQQVPQRTVLHPRRPPVRPRKLRISYNPR